MRSTHPHEFHMPKGPNLYLFALGGVACFALALLTVAFASIGGTSFIANLGGTATVVILIAGLIVSIVLAVVEKPKS